MDMSKAFDNVNREDLISDLRKILQEDELHILKLLVTKVILQVKNNNILGEKFITSKGIPQGDCLSPILFTLYLAKSLEMKEEKEEKKEDHNYNRSICKKIMMPRHLQDHNYQVYQEQGINIKQEFADDISRLNRYEEVVEELVKEDTEKLESRSFIINPEKTEKYKISKNSTDEWRKC